MNKTSISILELIDILENHHQNIIINFKYLTHIYQKQSRSRIRGSRNKQNNLVLPWLTTQEIDSDEYVPIKRFKINHDTATINLLVTRRVKLVTPECDRQIAQVGGILLNNLTQYNYYTIVSEGKINLDILKIKINNKQTFALLKEKNILTKAGKKVTEFDFNSEYDINLKNLPLIATKNHHFNLAGIFEDLLYLQIFKNILSACLRHKSALYCEEQIEELAKNYISPKLYLNFPTTNKDHDLNEALSKGTVTSRISYKITIGNTRILNLSKLYSANKLLDRLYEGYNQKEQKLISKPTCDLIWEPNILFQEKQLSSRIKINQIDEILGLKNQVMIINLLKKIKGNGLIHLWNQQLSGQHIPHEELISILSQTKKLLADSLETIYHQQISPLVFYITATGLIPQQLNPQKLTAMEIKALYPELKISKQEKKGTFFLVGDYVITVYPQTVYSSLENKQKSEISAYNNR